MTLLSVYPAAVSNVYPSCCIETSIKDLWQDIPKTVTGALIPISIIMLLSIAFPVVERRRSRNIVRKSSKLAPTHSSKNVPKKSKIHFEDISIVAIQTIRFFSNCLMLKILNIFDPVCM